MRGIVDAKRCVSVSSSVTCLFSPRFLWDWLQWRNSLKFNNIFLQVAVLLAEISQIFEESHHYFKYFFTCAEIHSHTVHGLWIFRYGWSVSLLLHLKPRSEKTIKSMCVKVPEYLQMNLSMFRKLWFSVTVVWFLEFSLTFSKRWPILEELREMLKPFLKKAKDKPSSIPFCSAPC